MRTCTCSPVITILYLIPGSCDNNCYTYTYTRVLSVLRFFADASYIYAVTLWDVHPR